MWRRRRFVGLLASIYDHKWFSSNFQTVGLIMCLSANVCTGELDKSKPVPQNHHHNRDDHHIIIVLTIIMTGREQNVVRNSLKQPTD